MTKAAAVDWRTMPAPQTPLQRAAFLDACVQWLVREPHAPGDGDGGLGGSVYIGEPPPRAAAEAAVASRVASTTSDLRACSPEQLACLVCGVRGEGVRPVVSNPFAQRHISLLCRACAAS